MHLNLFSTCAKASIFVLLLCSPAWVTAQSKQILKSLDETSYAAITPTHGAHLDVRVQSPGDLETMVRLYTGHTGKLSYKREGITMRNNKRVLIPFNKLAPVFQKTYLKVLWPKSALKDDFFHHTVVYRGHETLWMVSDLFTGKGNNYKKIKTASRLKSDQIGRGTKIKIPKDLLRTILREDLRNVLKDTEDPIFASKVELGETTVIEEEPSPPTLSAPGDPVTSQIPDDKPVDPTPNIAAAQQPANQQRAPETATQENQEPPADPAPTPNAQTESNQRRSADPALLKRLPPEIVQSRKDLTYGADSRGDFGIYRLKAGEAIYSSVVVRFCGLVRADDVNDLAKKIITFNRIPDETDIDIGTPIRIPYEYLEPEFRDDNDPEFIAYLENLDNVARVAVGAKADNLENVHVILDAGHGGRDPGAHFGSVWEDDYVYDIVCRVKLKLETETAAKAHFIVLDPSVQYKVQNVRRFKRDQDEIILTNPRFKLDTNRVTSDGVHLRWILANAIFQDLQRRKVPAENVVFASFHADSLHRSLSGSMVYVPDARKYPSRVSGNRYKRYKESKHSNFAFTRKQMVQAQARSTKFAQNFVTSLRKSKLRVHRQKPIRSLIYRNPRNPFVPAVLRFNRIPTRTLIEVCNLNNRGDRERLRDPKYRQQVADAFVDALLRTYDREDAKVQNAAAKTSRRAR